MERTAVSRLLNSKFLSLILFGMLLCSILSLVLFGVVGIGRSGDLFSDDYAILYKAGRDWLANINPYLNETEFIFAYPPNFSFFIVPLALLEFGVSKYCMVLLNVVSLSLIIWICCLNILKLDPRNSHIKCFLLASFIIGNPFTTHNFWMGQTSLILLASVMGAWHLGYQKDRWLLAGICLGISSFKPQLSILLFVWFLLERNWKLLAVSSVTFVLMCWYPLLTQGPGEMMRAWIYDGLGSYFSVDFNASGTQHVVGLSSMLNAAGIDAPSFKVVGIGLTILVWLLRKKINQWDVLGILMGITLTFVAGHDYDYVCLVSLITSLLIYTRDRTNLWFWLPSLVFLLIFPQRFIRISEMPVLYHWRTLVVLAMSSLAILSSLHHSKIENEKNTLVF